MLNVFGKESKIDESNVCNNMILFATSGIDLILVSNAFVTIPDSIATFGFAIYVIKNSRTHPC